MIDYGQKSVNYAQLRETETRTGAGYTRRDRKLADWVVEFGELLLLSYGTLKSTRFRAISLFSRF